MSVFISFFMFPCISLEPFLDTSCSQSYKEFQEYHGYGDRNFYIPFTNIWNLFTEICTKHRWGMIFLSNLDSIFKNLQKKRPQKFGRYLKCGKQRLDLITTYILQLNSSEKKASRLKSLLILLGVRQITYLTNFWSEDYLTITWQLPAAW